MRKTNKFGNVRRAEHAGSVLSVIVAIILAYFKFIPKSVATFIFIFFFFALLRTMYYVYIFSCFFDLSG